MDAMKVISSISALIDCMDAMSDSDLGEQLEEIIQRNWVFVNNCYKTLDITPRSWEP